jgi:hypothetical protein
MRLAIMQPYLFPYIGYFQLINAADMFVVYDNIKYTKKGWINRNRILCNGKAEYISLPVKKDSDFLNIDQRVISDDWQTEKHKMLNKIKELYKKAPFFSTAFDKVHECINYKEENLFFYIKYTLETLCAYLSIKTPFVASSGISIDHDLRSEEKVLAICNALHANTYINPIGGVELYSKELFKQKGIELLFLKTNSFQYTQFDNDFIPFLSIIDVMMFNAPEKIHQMINTEFTFD